jgi:hypothetical protein
MAKVTLDGREFRTVGEAKQFLQTKMKGYALNQPVPDEDCPIWFSYLQKHEWFEKYVEFGIHRFVFVKNEKFPTSGMAVENRSGERWPFSYHKYLDGKPLTKLTRVKVALRMEITSQIDEFRNKIFEGNPIVPCALTGQLLNMGQCDVHHSGKPFVQIADEFLEMNRHVWCGIETESVGKTGHRLLDRNIAAAWADFHRANSVLQITSRKVNQKIGSGGYRMLFEEPIPIPPPY